MHVQLTCGEKQGSPLSIHTHIHSKTHTHTHMHTHVHTSPYNVASTFYHCMVMLWCNTNSVIFYSTILYVSCMSIVNFILCVCVRACPYFSPSSVAYDDIGVYAAKTLTKGTMIGPYIGEEGTEGIC